MAKRPGGAMIQSAAPTQSQLMPVLTKWQDVGKKSEFAAVLVTIITVLLLFPFGDIGVMMFTYPKVIQGHVFLVPIYTSAYLILTCAYLMLLSLYFIRRMTGKDKSWLLMIGVGMTTAYMLWLFKTQGMFSWMYEFFHITLAGGEVKGSDSLTQTFVKHFIGTGFFEETFKALPLFVIAIASNYMPPAIRAKFGIEEPLDGILLGAASGGGFAFMETLAQYISDQLVDGWREAIAVNLFNVPDSMSAIDAWWNKLDAKQYHYWFATAQNMISWHPGMSLLIPRSLSEGFGHMAYAGCFGYFIGLSVMKPQQRWKILGIGLLLSSCLHALWDSLAFSEVLLAIVAVLSYAVLAAGILKAREISPNRATLMPSIFLGALTPTASVAAAYAGSPAGGMHTGGAVPEPPPAGSVPFAVAPKEVPPNPLPSGTASLRVGTKYLVIVPGLRLMAHQVPGLQAQSAEGVVAEVTRNPNDPSVLGLTNLSTTSWEVVTSSSSRKEIQPGQTVKLSPGAKIDFGETDGEVR